ncbi:MAG: AmmeMemoRadiSam system protein B [Aquificaceae bacterium]|nr:AmmeMemoRadiSam system protein B [Aquificaceae bacterium]
MRVRKPAVAGYFYPSDRKRLEEYVDRLMGEKVEVEGRLRGRIVPQAGYECAGSVAGRV